MTKKIKARTIHNPIISVLMCAYNAVAYIQDAINSVLEQSFKDFEFIIVDDGSTDETAQIIRRFSDKRLRLIQCRHDYIASLNKGMRACKGDYIARIDADDIMMPHRLETQIEVMLKKPQLAACFSWGTTFGLIDETIGNQTKGVIDHAFFWLLTGNYLIHPTAMLRTKFIRQNRLRYKRYSYAEDYKLWCDITRIGGEIYIIPEPLIRYRMSNTQVSYVHHATQSMTRLSIQQEILEELLSRLHHPQRTRLLQIYHNLIRMNQAKLIQGDEIVIFMYKLLWRTKFFVQ